MSLSAKTIVFKGRVQGVGFRPFIYRLARQYGIFGTVYNGAGQVHIFAQGAPQKLELFVKKIVREAPPLAQPLLQSNEDAPCQNIDGFTILVSKNEGPSQNHIPPDLFLCDECLAEMNDPQERRTGYPFINCTQCGPRYTIITALPYDRPNTSMAEFPLCPDCQAEYENPEDRRFHAEPLACETCGPALSFVQNTESIVGNSAAIDAALMALRQDKIIAVKGVGGYHLMCDARSEIAVQNLRARKHRPEKPLAVMFPMQGGDGLDAVRACAHISEIEAKTLCAPERPIVLATKTQVNGLSNALAPKLNELGVFLPYAPLHHLVLTKFGTPLVATSGNISGEPVIIDNAMAEQKLANIADGFLHHNRPIVRPADDSVVRVIAGKPRPFRLGRGIAPVELELPRTLHQPVLATGGHLKNAIALAWGERVIISPHIGGLGSLRSMDVFEQVVADLQKLYSVNAETIITDTHQGYASSRWAEKQNLPIIKVQHHRAHASALAGGYSHVKNWLMFTWDGVGLGDDGSLWGGEGFIGRPSNWKRVSSWRPFTLTGGDSAGREPWRSASALMWEAGLDWNTGKAGEPLARQVWEQRINSFETTSVGRIFDAASCLITGIETCSFEGQGPMQLESLCGAKQTAIPLPLTLDANQIWRSDWQPLLSLLGDDTKPAPKRSAIFHASMAEALVDQAMEIKKHYNFDTVGLCGGVFQNRVLAEMVLDLLEHENIKAYLPLTHPANDGGLAYGQIIETLYKENT